MRVTSLLGGIEILLSVLPYNSCSRAPSDPPSHRRTFLIWIVLSVLEEMLQAVRRRQRRERKERRLTGPAEKLYDSQIVVLPLLEVVVVA